MAGLKLLKNRLENVKSIQKITSAMKLVSSVKYNRFEKMVGVSRPYSMLLKQSLNDYLLNRNQAFVEPELIYSKRDVKSVLIIVYSSAKGLCGSFNVGMAKFLTEKINDFKSKGINVICFCIGKKLKQHLELLLPKSNIKYLDNVEKQLNIDNVGVFSKYIIRSFKRKMFDRVFVLYNKFNSVVNRELRFDMLLPFTENLPKKVGSITEFFEKVNDSFDRVMHSYLTACIYQSLVENLASEHSARMLAMDSANKNADDMIKALNLEYNKKRQSIITNELIEVISGAEAV